MCCPLCKEEEYSSRSVGDIKRHLKLKHGVHNDVKQDSLIKESKRMWKQNVRLLPAPEFLPPGRKFINEEADDEYIRLEEPPNPQEILRWQMSDILNMDVTGWSAAEGNSSEIMRADDERPRTMTREDTAMEISTDPMSWIPVEKSCIPEFLENMNSPNGKDGKCKERSSNSFDEAGNKRLRHSSLKNLCQRSVSMETTWKRKDYSLQVIAKFYLYMHVSNYAMFHCDN